MMRIAITPPTPHPCEPAMIEMILRHGWDMVHLRHPGATRKEMQNIIEAVDQRYHNKIRLHGHFDLLNHFNLGGIQLNKRCPQPPSNYRGVFSSSCHTVEEVIDSPHCDYVTLSPIFSSISKADYPASTFDFSPLKAADSLPKIIALGGITPERATILNREIFSGYAVLGYLFEELDSEWEGELERRLLKFNE